MSVASGVVKQTAKTALKGNYIKAVVAALILSFSWIITVNLAGVLEILVGSTIAEVILIVMTVSLIFPLALGFLRYIWRILFSVADNPIAVFYWFSERKLYLRAMKLILNITLRTLFWLLVLNIPSILLLVLSKSFIFELIGTSTPVWTANLSYYSILLKNISIILVFFIMLKYYMAPLLLVADDNIEVGEAIYNSTVISRKSAFDCLGLIFASLGWILLSLLILPLPFTLPLLFGYYAVHIRFAVAEYNCHLEEQKMKDAGFI